MKKYLLGVFLLLAVMATPASVKAITIEELKAELQAKILQLQAQLNALIGQIDYCSLDQDLSIGDGEQGDDLVPEVKKLQKFLISKGYLASHLATGYFGKLTQDALQKWQNKISKLNSTGVLDSSSRSYLQEDCQPDYVSCLMEGQTVGINNSSVCCPGLIPLNGICANSGIPVSYSAPTFNYNAGQASHRLYLNFSNNGKIISIAPEANNANCFGFNTAMTNICKANSYTSGTSCGIYLQRNPYSSGRCIAKVVYQVGTRNVTKYFESSGTVNVETIGEVSITDLNNSDVTVNVQRAKNTLINYLNYLALGEYDKVSNLYATDYTALRSWNPGVNPANHSELFKRGCEINGLECLKLKEIVKTEVDGNRVILTVKLVDPVSLSGTYCAKGADLASTCLSEFKMTVVNLGDDIGYRVVDLPPYHP